MYEKAVYSTAEYPTPLLSTSNSASWMHAWGRSTLHKGLNNAISRARKTEKKLEEIMSNSVSDSPEKGVHSNTSVAVLEPKRKEVKKKKTLLISGPKLQQGLLAKCHHCPNLDKQYEWLLTELNLHQQLITLRQIKKTRTVCATCTRKAHLQLQK